MSRFCRWCKEPNLVSRGNKTGLCEKHWNEYVQLRASIRDAEYVYKESEYKEPTTDKCECGKGKLIGRKYCSSCQYHKVKRMVPCGNPDCNRKMQISSTLCWKCELQRRKSAKKMLA